MTTKEFDLAVVIGDLADGRYDHLTMLQLAYRLTEMLPESKTKAELHSQICKKFVTDNAVLLAAETRGSNCP